MVLPEVIDTPETVEYKRLQFIAKVNRLFELKSAESYEFYRITSKIVYKGLRKKGLKNLYHKRNGKPNNYKGIM